jgi:hypothetical protein
VHYYGNMLNPRGCESGPTGCRWATTDAILTPMQLSTITRITPEQFFAWISGQEERYELIDGEVVMMAGAGRTHDRVVVNLTELRRASP